MLESLLAREAVVQFDGNDVRLLRPTVAHFVAAQDAETRGTWMPAWYCAAHVLGADGSTLWKHAETLKLLQGSRPV